MVDITRAGRLGSAALEALLAAGDVRDLSPGDRLTETGSADLPSGILLSGLLRYQRQGRDGHRQIINLILPGEVFRAETLAREGYSVEAATPVWVIVASRAVFDCLLEGHPDLARTAKRSQKAQLDRLRWLTWCFLSLDTTARLCAFLDCATSLWPAEKLALGSVRLTLPLSRLDMADLLAMSPAALDRTLGVLEGTGTLRVLPGDGLEIFDPRGLRSLSSHEGPTLDCPHRMFARNWERIR